MTESTNPLEGLSLRALEISVRIIHKMHGAKCSMSYGTSMKLGNDSGVSRKP